MDKTQLEKIKEELIAQIDSWQAGDEQKEAAKKQMREMADEDFEKFLIKNNVVKQDKDECPFCLICEKKLVSYEIGENNNAVAVLEINPLSRGHVLVIPRKHQEGKPEESVSAFAEEIAGKLKEKLNPKDVKVYGNQIQGHTIVNVVPDYGVKQERKKASKEELEEVKSILSQKELKEPELKQKEREEKKEEKKIEEKREEKLPKAPARFP